MKPKISIITLGVSDIQKSLAFYRDGLGFETHEYKEGDEAVFFKMEGSWLVLYPKDKLAEDATISPEGSGFSGTSLAHNVESQEKVDEVFAFMLSKGAKAIKKPQDVLEHDQKSIEIQRESRFERKMVQTRKLIRVSATEDKTFYTESASSTIRKDSVVPFLLGFWSCSREAIQAMSQIPMAISGR